MGSQVEILELKDLEKECMLARIRLTLAQHDPSTTAITGKIGVVFITYSLRAFV